MCFEWAPQDCRNRCFGWTLRIAGMSVLVSNDVITAVDGFFCGLGDLDVILGSRG